MLRSLESVLQYSILAYGFGTTILHRVGLRTLPSGLPAHTGIGLIDGLGLSLYRLVLLAMSVGSVVKQNIWVTTLSRDPMTVGAAVAIAMINAVSNSLSTYSSVTSISSASTEAGFPQPALLVHCLC